MTASEMAEYLDGKDYCLIGERENKMAKRDDLIIIYATPYDAIAVRGCMNEDFNYLEDSVLYVNRDGFFSGCPYGDTSCKYCSDALRKYRSIEIEICEHNGTSYYEFDTNMSHSSFELYDGNALCCIGIVISLYDI